LSVLKNGGKLPPKNRGEDLEKLPSYYGLIKSYEGKGSIHLSDGTKLDCDFECGQNEEGDIIVGLNTDPSNYGVIGRGLDDSKFISRVSGETSTGQWLEASIAGWTDFTLSSSAFLVCYAKDLTVGKEPSVPPNALKSHLVNFKFVLPLSWHFRGYEITIKKVDGYDEIEKEMRATNRPKKTAELTVTSPSNHIVSISEVEDILHDICLLLSLAKGCRIQWLYWDAYSADNTLIRSRHWHGWSSPFSNWFIIFKMPPQDISEYLSQVFEPYQDVQKEGIWRFDQAITHFVDTVSSENMLELKSINLVVLTDYLTQLFAKHKKMNYFIERGSFADKKENLQDAVRKLLKDVFSQQDLVENEYLLEKKKGVKKTSKKKELNNIIFDQTVQEMGNVIECLNSRSFKSLLRRLQKDYLNLKVDAEELDLFVKIRNKLVHEASFLDKDDFIDMKIPYEDPPKQYFRILSLTSRILLAILKYRGYYHDWVKFKEGEYEGFGASGRVKMQYLEGW
jgi:hypothetical protein